MPDNCGVIYPVFGRQAQAACVKSLVSLRATNPGLEAVVVGDTPMFKYNMRRLHWPTGIPVFNPAKPKRYQFLSGAVKPRLYGMSPFDRTLYLDADTIVHGDLAPGFAMLDEVDLLVTPHGPGHDLDFYRGKGNPGRGRNELENTIREFGSGEELYWNTGVLFWRRCPAVEAMFILWLEEWQRYGAWDEQLALMRATRRVPELRVRILSTKWNAKRPTPGMVIEHQYGQGIAWRR